MNTLHTTSPHQHHPRLRHTHHKHLGGVFIADMQVNHFFQKHPADGLGFELGQFCPEVGLDGVVHGQAI